MQHKKTTTYVNYTTFLSNNANNKIFERVQKNDDADVYTLYI